MPKRPTRGHTAIVQENSCLTEVLCPFAIAKHFDLVVKDGMVRAALVKVSVRCASSTFALDPNETQGIVPRCVDGHASMCGRLGMTAHEPT